MPRLGGLSHTLYSAKHTKRRPHRICWDSGNEHGVDSQNWGGEQHRKHYLASVQNRLEHVSFNIVLVHMQALAYVPVPDTYFQASSTAGSGHLSRIVSEPSVKFFVQPMTSPCATS